jgi:hypothetical protein
MFSRLWTLTRIGMALSLGPITFVAAPTPVQANQPAGPDADRDLDGTYQGEAPERYAQVKAVEGDVLVRKGELEEKLERGLPVAEGDLIDSRGRGVLQLGDGTRVAFADRTRFQVASLFTDKNGERQVLLRLEQGRLRIALGSQSEARLRVDTKVGMATMLDRGNATIQVESDQSVRVKVHSGHLTFSNDADKARINAGERLTIYSFADRLNRVSAFNTYDRDSFDAYCERALEIRRGASWDRVPAEIRYYSDDLDDHGEWVDVPDVGWCWRPRAVVADWRPYWQGRWGAYPGGMTWVSDDPWGYVTFHFGRWGWHSGWGWYWMPGRYYSPAWVAWNWNSGYYGWAPLNYWNRPCSWGYGAWGGGYCWNVVQYHHINTHRIHHHVHSDRTVIAGFHGGTGASSWNGSGWRTAPLLVSQAEFRSPAQMARAFDRQVSSERMRAYERTAQSSTGRVVIRREPQPSPHGEGIPFEDRGRSRVPGPPILKGNTGVVPPDRRGSEPSRPTDVVRPDSVRDRGGVVPPGRREPSPENRGRDFFGEERRTAPQERPREDRKPEPSRREGPVERRSERTYDPPPARERSYDPPPARERVREERPAPREERRSEPTRDRPRESYREEHRPAPAPAPSRPSSPPPSSSPGRSAPSPSPGPSSGGGPRR